MEQPRVVYERRLPGGGFVHVEERATNVDGATARLSVERRSDPVRRNGHLPPVIAHAEGPTLAAVSQYLIAIANDNVAVALGLLRASGRSTAKI